MMSRPYLIIETPRAGELGHRFVVPPSIRDETEVARVAAAASREERGEDYVSVKRNVEQRLAGGAVRHGPETLILTGIDVGELDEHVIERLKSSLENLWPRVDNLVAELAQGSYLARDTLAHAAVLEDWKDELSRTDKLPIFATPSRKRSFRRPIALMLLGTFLGLTVLVAIMFARRGLEPTLPPEAPRSPTQETQRLRSTLEHLAGRWRCSPEDVALSLQRAANWDKQDKHQTLDAFLLSAGSEELVLLRTGQLIRGSPGAYFGFIESDHPAQVAVLRSLLHTDGDDATLRLRHSLFECWEAFNQVRGTSHEVAELLEKADVMPNGFTRTIGFLRNIRVPSGLGNGFNTPSTPIFDRQDVLIVDLIEAIFRDGPSQGLSAAFEQSRAVDVLYPPFLADKLRRLASRADDIKKAGEDERKNVVDKIPKEGEVKSSFNSLEKLFACLGHLSSG